MNFLAPWYVPALAAGLTIPPLLLLYFLKLRRREVPISSTLLWKQAVQDLQVNAPFQRLRSNLLLFLQLMVLLAAILAICEPMWAGDRGEGKVYILMIDRSASMSVDEGRGDTRLSLAKSAALEVVDNLRRADQAMVIAFDERATVLCPLTSDQDALRRAIRTVTQSDGRGRLTEAMRLAEAPTSLAGESPDVKDRIRTAQYLLFTDGRLADADEVNVQHGTLEIVRVGKAADNVGIVDLDVRRNYERPEQVSVLTRVRNFGGEAATRDVSLFVDGVMKTVETVELAPLATPERLASMELPSIPPEGSEAMAAFELLLDTEAELEVRLSGDDAFPTDDSAFAVVKPPRGLSVLLVTPGNVYLRRALASMAVDRVEVWAPSEYEEADTAALIESGRCRFDVVIFDGHSTDRLPPGNYVFFAAVPLVEDVVLGEPVEQEVLLDWDETHPILRYVNMDAVTIVSWHELTVPQQATTVIEATNGPLVAVLNRERNRYLMCAFGIFDESRTMLNAPWVIMDPGFVVFMYNALRHLSGSTTVGQYESATPGEAFTVAAKPGAELLTVRRPDDATDSVPVRSSGLATYGKTDRIGIYRIDSGIPGERARAVNLLDDHESFIAPREGFRVSGEPVETTEEIAKVNRPLWPYLLAALGAILLVEWFVYTRRMYV